MSAKPSDVVARVLAKLDKVMPSGKGWTALCPAHPDTKPSLSVSVGDGGKLLLRCHVGCTFEEIREVLDELPMPTAANSESKRKSKQNLGKCIATYNYHDESGELLYSQIRYAGHEFRCNRPNGLGPPIWNLSGVRMVLYRLPQLLMTLAAKPNEWIYIVEGEKDVDRLAKEDFTATCNFGGAEKWRDEYSEFLRGRAVVIIPDNDEAGERHLAQVARSLTGIAASIKVLRLPGLPTKGDVSDWLAVEDNYPEELDRLARRAPEWQPEPDDGDILSIMPIADVEAEEVTFLWHDRIPRGKLTIEDGNPDVGKTCIAIDISARLSSGRKMPYDDEQRPPGSVLFLTSEDGLGDTIRPRLDAAGADLDRVHVLDCDETFPTIPKSVDILQRTIEQYRIELVVLDPLVAFLDPSVDVYRDASVRQALSPLVACCASTGTAVLSIRHLNKNIGGSAITRGGGSIAFVATARSALVAGRDPDDPTRAVLAQVKGNLGPRVPSLSYRIVGCGNSCRVEWLGESSYAADDLLATPGSPHKKLEEAVDFLETKLTDGPRPVSDITTKAMEEGITPATLRRAEKELDLVKHKSGFRGGWLWELPNLSDNRDAHAQH